MNKITIFLPSLEVGGSERVMIALAQGFLNNGYRVDLVTARAEGPFLNKLPVGLNLINLNVKRVLFSLKPLFYYLKNEKPDILLSALDYANLVALWARAVAKVPTKCYITVHNEIYSFYQQAPSLKDQIIPYLMQKFYPWADGIIAVSHGVAQEISKFTGVNERKIKVIYNPVIDNDFYEKAKEPVHHSWFIEKDDPLIIGIGRLTRIKGFANLIKAFAKIKDRFDGRLIILGEGEERKYLEQLIGEHKLGDRVQLLGCVDNPYKYLARADLFVLPSLSEGLPNVIVEAMALGIPIIATDCSSGPKEILCNYGLGKLIPAKDADILTRAIIDAISEQRKLVNPEAQIDLYKFHLDNVVKEYLSFFRSSC